MKPASFEYLVPESVEHAVELLGRYDGEAKVLAGGQSLVPAMNFRFATPAAVVDLNGLPGHDRVLVDGGELVIEMLVRHSTLERYEIDDSLSGLLARTARFVGHLPIRVRGTFVGSIAHADPAAEWCMLVRALDATIVARGRGGERRIAAEEFFEGPFMTALGPDEVVTAVRVPLLGRAGTGMCEKSQTAGDFATVASIATLELSDGVVARVRIGVAGAEGRPVRPAEAEAALTGRAPDAGTLGEAARAAAASVDPTSDAVASADYRRNLVEVLTRRALEEAAAGAAA
jgi:aerobic carbon-monoxide dehydrogenase medium subunit